MFTSIKININAKFLVDGQLLTTKKLARIELFLLLAAVSTEFTVGFQVREMPKITSL